MIKLIAFKALLCLGVANELKIINLEPSVRISKNGMEDVTND